MSEMLKEQLLRQFSEELLNQGSEQKQNTNDSLIFLESRTLNLLILSMIINQEKKSQQTATEAGTTSSQKEMLKQFDQLIAESKEVFEEILALLNDQL